jgi:hypothetical protein
MVSPSVIPITLPTNCEACAVEKAMQTTRKFLANNLKIIIY